MLKPRPPLLASALHALRVASGWSVAELGLAVGVGPDLISKYQKGKKPLSRERLEELLAAMGIPPEAVDAYLYTDSVAFPRESPGSPVEPSTAERKSIHRAAAGAGLKAAESTFGRLTENARRLRATEARREADDLWKALRRVPPERRRAALEVEPRYWTWAVAERLCAESAKAAAHRVDRAMELASLALRAAELSPGSEPWRWRLQGYAWAFVGNARRVGGDLPSAEEAFTRSERLWETGASADPGVLDGSRLLDLKASLRRYQDRFEEALDLLDRAHEAAISNEAKARLLVNKANTLELMGDSEAALTELQRARSLTVGTRDARLLALIRFGLAVNLAQLGRYTEAEDLLDGLRELTAGKELDLIRCLWLEGRVRAGLGRREDALPALEQVQRYFTEEEIAYDAALASLEVAILYLQEERTGEVQRLAEEMLWIFQAQGVPKEALAALRLFCEASVRGEATVELARSVLGYLRRARLNPNLRFEA